jgi:hypothetical protein
MNKVISNSELIKEIKVFKEEHETNYGHTDLIIQGNVIFPPKKYNKFALENKDMGFIFIQSEYSSFNKQKEINSKVIKPVLNQKNYFELYRYAINKLQKPNDDSSVTFTVSLFKPNDKFNDDYNYWINRYLINHLKQILLINFFFPDANYRTYLDYYMLAKFELFEGNDERLKITKYFDKFEHYDFENFENESINFLLINYYNEIKKYEDYKFENGLTRILFYYDIACRSIINSGIYILRDKTGDFFVYKFKGPFIENECEKNEGHITNGYIGQVVRYISTIQKDYIWNDTKINRSTHLVWRDAHKNSLGYNDFKWINELNKICKTRKNKLFFLPSSIDYVQSWHDETICKVDNKENIQSPIAGIIQFTNFTDDETFLPFEIYKQCIGMIFLINLNNDLPLKIHRPWSYISRLNNFMWKSEYDYGIEEYCFSSFFNLDYLMKNSIFYRNHFIERVFNLYFDDDKIGIAEFLLFKFIIDNDIIKIDQKVNKFEFIKLIENLRDNILFKDNKALSLLLAIYPTKYFFDETIFSIDNNVYNNYTCEEQSFEDRLLVIPDFLKKFKELTLENLFNININCYTTIINNTIEWCVDPYAYKSEVIVCSPSGFYFDSQESDEIGYLRSPDDLNHVINILYNNKLKKKLNKTKYKLNEERTHFYDNIKCNVLDLDYEGKIKPEIQHKILEYNNAYQHISHIPEESYSNIIWRELNTAGYDVPPYYFINLNYDNYVKLSTIEGWINNTLILLKTCNQSQESKFEKMDEYEKKYIKYKLKYLNLKK